MRRLLAIAVVTLLAFAAVACGGSADDRNAEALAELDAYPGAVEIDRHSEDVDINGETQRVLKVQYASADARERIQSYYGEKLLRAGYRTDTAPDDTLPREALRFRTSDSKGTVIVIFSDQQVTWPTELGVQPGGSPPPDATTFFVMQIRIGE